MQNPFTHVLLHAAAGSVRVAVGTGVVVGGILDTVVVGDLDRVMVSDTVTDAVALLSADGVGRETVDVNVNEMVWVAENEVDRDALVPSVSETVFDTESTNVAETLREAVVDCHAVVLVEPDTLWDCVRDSECVDVFVPSSVAVAERSTVAVPMVSVREVEYDSVDELDEDALRESLDEGEALRVSDTVDVADSVLESACVKVRLAVRVGDGVSSNVAVAESVFDALAATVKEAVAEAEVPRVADEVHDWLLTWVCDDVREMVDVVVVLSDVECVDEALTAAVELLERLVEVDAVRVEEAVGVSDREAVELSRGVMVAECVADGEVS